MLRWLLLSLLTLLLLPGITRAEEAKKDAPKPADAATANSAKEEEIPPGLTTYMGRKVANFMHFEGAPWLTRESRDREEDSKTMFAQLKIKEGQTVCDLGAGNGYYTLPMAKAVGEKGKCYAVEIQPEMLRFLKKRAAAQKVENIEYVLGTFIDPKLPADSQDLILLVDVYHEFSHPEHMLKAIRKSLKPDGKLVLVEFRAEDPDVPIKPEHKMSKKQVNKELTANGFKLVEEFDKLPWQHMMFFQRDEKADKKDGEKKDDAKEKQ